ncbi:MAG TPA: Zn-ribbon domain-containing OB-fold protein [Desulfobaccales bacterium]|jgi:uncharacterized OB-fold protein
MYKLTHLQYFAALKEDILKGLKCLDCGTITVPPKAVCDDCGSTNQEITQLSGDGTIRTFTVIRVAPEGFKAPYVVVLAQLREGPWLTGLLNGLDPDSASMELIGKKVKMGHQVVQHMRHTAGEGVVPLFSLVD